VTEILTPLLDSHREPLYLLFRHLRARDRPFLLWSDVVHEYESFCATDEGAPLRDPEISNIVRRTQEVVVDGPFLFLAVRREVARWRYIQIHAEEMAAREVPVSEFLAVKERMIEGSGAEEQWAVEVDLRPFDRRFPKLEEARSIGRGGEYLNRYLSSRLFSREGDGRDRLLRFLSLHRHQGQPLMLNGTFQEVEELRQGLRQALKSLADADADAPGMSRELRRLGFEPGWGRTVQQVRETMGLLSDLLEAPSADLLQRFLDRIPMIFSIAILSPHGYLAQSRVLGMPDTGGQVVYILDQVRALEQAMRQAIHDHGLDVEPQIVVLSRLIPEAEGTTCDQRLEPIIGTRNARILRVPFRDRAGEVIPHWISRFRIWPYLERYAREAERELLAELGGRPDLLIGNYSDGNLVASLMADSLGVTRCTIAHALEKTKYLLSDLHWREHEAEHHFSCQFTADLIAMNTADFIVTSTYQEIAGTKESVGQYESYQAFTLPGLYRVVGGIDCFDPKFNIVSPGADPRVFFPYHERSRRMAEVRGEIRELVFGGPDASSRGEFRDPERPILFAMSRLDRIKNMTGFLRWYAESEGLRQRANVLLVGGYMDPSDSRDPDEGAQIRAMHELLDHHGLECEVRWVEMQTDKNRVGELYRVVADTRGAFVQPALFEAFGLTVVEAMSSGLPTFATRYGGPLEVVEDGVSGFHIDPTLGSEAVARMEEFLARCADDPAAWDRISEGAVRRVGERYNWGLHADRLLKLSRVYGFWRFMTRLEREESRRYLEMFYGLMYRPRAALVEGTG